MRLQTVFLAAVLAAPQAVAQTTPALPSSPAEWRAAAVRDIEAGYRVTLAEHAGAHDPHNPAFLANLEAARAHANALAARVADGAGYTAAVLAFSSRIQDGHAGLYPTFDMDDVKPPQWPGFMAAWRGDLFVHAAEEGSARAGERIVSCDGKDARALMEQNLFPWFGRIREEGQWWSQVRNLFFDFGNPFVQRPQRCVFELDGRRTERTLAWRAVPESARTWGRDSMYGDTLPVGLTEPRKNLFWVAMPTFQPSDQERAAYQAIYQQVRSQRARFLGADAIVVDLRRNQGGSSWWSRDFAAALWGEARLKERDAASKAKVEIWYRAAPGNIAFFRQMKEDEAAAGRPESAEWWAKREGCRSPGARAFHPPGLRHRSRQLCQRLPRRHRLLQALPEHEAGRGAEFGRLYLHGSAPGSSAGRPGTGHRADQALGQPPARQRRVLPSGHSGDGGTLEHRRFPRRDRARPGALRLQRRRRLRSPRKRVSAALLITITGSPCHTYRKGAPPWRSVSLAETRKRVPTG
jgi:hypothetical protein